jgi:hypothetical protein
MRRIEDAKPSWIAWRIFCIVAMIIFIEAVNFLSKGDYMSALMLAAVYMICSLLIMVFAN